ncbi:MAG: protease pro-enzyme activation domain-containing protein, partial [Candidatus Acidiferrales bacterium]
RSPAQETALQQLLEGQKSKSSPYYHQWLTPTQFGQQFGASDSDIQTITSWLEAHGFTVNSVSPGRTVIDFSGNAGLVRAAFHTEIHKYVVNGESHWANNADPQIPAALAPVIAGLVSLNNFKKKPMYKITAHPLSPATTNPITLETEAGQCTTSLGATVTCYAVAPADFATIYNSEPLWSAGIDGTGQTIAIVGETDINCQDIINFRSFYGLSTTFPDDCGPNSNVQIILDGPDPGYQEDETEADLDVEWSGAVAKGAHIDFVESESTETTQGIDLSAEYIVNNNLAPVMSESYGECEAFLLTAGNQFYNALWEQAAAQGITVITSAGDSGSAGCDDDNSVLFAQEGANVSGLNSTPYNVSAGGTDFNYVSNPATSYWNAGNSTISTGQTQESAKGYIPEIPWDDSCAASGVVTACSNQSIDQEAFVTGGLNIVAAGGGESNCVLSVVEGEIVNCDASTAFPNGGYPKPAWQSGSAVTGLASTDGVRDVPDISLYAAAESASNSFYPICESDLNTNNAECTSFSLFAGVGGTSSSAPAFAGIMAMINQYTSTTPAPLAAPVLRQGNANYELYALASKQVTAATSCTSDSNPNTADTSGCTFYDINSGSNSVPCEGDSFGCSNTSETSTNAGVVEQSVSLTNGAPDGTVAWVASAGYDLATGLGSVNVYNLVHNWPAVVGAFHSTSSTLKLCTGGTAVCQPGDSPTALSFVHGTTVTVDIGVSSGSGTPTGNAAIIGSPNPLSNTNGNFAMGTTAAVDIFHLTSTGALNIDAYPLTNGAATGTTVYLPGGSYAINTHYTGDGTFGASDSAAVTVNISAENSTATLAASEYNPVEQEFVALPASVPYGTAEIFRLDVFGTSGTSTTHPETATGAVLFTDEGTPISQTSVNGGANEAFTLNSEGYAEVQTPVYGLFNNTTLQSGYVIQPLTVGAHSIQASYLGAQSSFNGAGTAGDSSYNQSQTSAVAVNVTKGSTVIADAPAAPTPPCTTSEPSTFTLGSSVTIAALVETTSYANVPTGSVTFASTRGENLSFVTATPFYDPNYGFSELCASVTYTPTGTETITANYIGDTNYLAPSAAATTTITSGSVASATNSTVTASPTSIAANGTTTSTITVTLKDVNSNPVSGKTVTLAGTGSSSISAASGTSSSSGVVTFTVKDSLPETDTYTAADTTDDITLTHTASVTFTATYAITSANSTSGTAVPISTQGGSGSATLGVTLAAGTTSVTLSFVLDTSPANAVDLPTCSLSPNPDTTAGTSNVMMMCNTTAAHVPPMPAVGPKVHGTPLVPALAALAALLAILILLALPERRRGYALLVLLLVVAVGAVVACGGGGSSGGGGGGGGGATGTTIGLYEYTVSGGAGGQPVIV